MLVTKHSEATTAQVSYPFTQTTRFQQHGVGLIEVLAAVIILSIGFLAAGRMQVQGVRAAQEANVRSQAFFLVNDMADRMRANSAGTALNAYNDADTSNNNYQQPACALNLTNPIPCTPQMLAQNDLAEWSRYINPPDPSVTNPLLPGGDNVSARGTITQDAAGEVFVITVTWSQIIDGVEQAQTLSTEFIK